MTAPAPPDTDQPLDAQRLELAGGVPRNPFMNAGVLVIVDRLTAAGCADVTAGPAGSDADRRRRDILALMMTCGHYDGSGRFAVQVGLPSKSRVSHGRARDPISIRCSKSCATRSH